MIAQCYDAIVSHLRERHRLDSLLLVLLELDARVLEQVHRVLGVHVLSQVELEVELPRGRSALGETQV